MWMIKRKYHILDVWNAIACGGDVLNIRTKNWVSHLTTNFRLKIDTNTIFVWHLCRGIWDLMSRVICVSAPTEHPKESKYRPVLEVFPFTKTPNPFTPSLWKVPYSLSVCRRGEKKSATRQLHCSVILNGLPQPRPLYVQPWPVLAGLGCSLVHKRIMFISNAQWTLFPSYYSLLEITLKP